MGRTPGQGAEAAQECQREVASKRRAAAESMAGVSMTSDHMRKKLHHI